MVQDLCHGGESGGASGVHKTTYLYLVDEFTGKPVLDEEEVFPIKLTNTKEFVREHFGMLRASLLASFVINKSLGLSRLHGLPVAELSPETVALAAKVLGEALELSSPNHFAFLQATAHGSAYEAAATPQICAAAVQSLTNVLVEHDARLGFADLRRIALGRSPLVSWTDKANFERIESTTGKTLTSGNNLAPFSEMAELVYQTSDSLEFDHFVDLVGIMSTDGISVDYIKKHTRVPYWPRLKQPYKAWYPKLQLEADADQLYQGFQMFKEASMTRMRGQAWRALVDAVQGKHVTKQEEVDDLPDALLDSNLAKIHKWFAIQMGESPTTKGMFEHFSMALAALAKVPTPDSVQAAAHDASARYANTEYQYLWGALEGQVGANAEVIQRQFEAYKKYLNESETACGMRKSWVERLRQCASGAVALWQYHSDVSDE
eukprot:c16203_g2_i2.p1 GENE.c16203_g2_i2~~c16203_g2_i2.p1  ORF type:complete len:434 (-),score=123.95 c16203_g2_i2:112-1413(-)